MINEPIMFELILLKKVSFWSWLVYFMAWNAYLALESLWDSDVCVWDCAPGCPRRVPHLCRCMVCWSLLSILDPCFQETRLGFRSSEDLESLHLLCESDPYLPQHESSNLSTWAFTRKQFRTLRLLARPGGWHSEPQTRSLDSEMVRSLDYGDTPHRWDCKFLLL